MIGNQLDEKRSEGGIGAGGCCQSLSLFISMVRSDEQDGQLGDNYCFGHHALKLPQSDSHKNAALLRTHKAFRLGLDNTNSPTFYCVFSTSYWPRNHHFGCGYDLESRNRLCDCIVSFVSRTI